MVGRVEVVPVRYVYLCVECRCWVREVGQVRFDMVCMRNCCGGNGEWQHIYTIVAAMDRTLGGTLVYVISQTIVTTKTTILLTFLRICKFKSIPMSK